MTDICLVVCSGGKEIETGLGVRHEFGEPALLVSYAYLKGFRVRRENLIFRSWMMDSGAFTARQAGKPVDFDEYMACCVDLLANDPKLTEVFALDVIGDPEACMRNYEVMRKAKIPHIPVYHSIDPIDNLIELGRLYPKIALGGMVGRGGRPAPKGFKMKWCEQCFARVWPKLIHGLAVGSPELLRKLPFDSVDASTWHQRPGKYGQWMTFGNIRSPGPHNLAAEVDTYLRLEQELRQRWGQTLQPLRERSHSFSPGDSTATSSPGSSRPTTSSTSTRRRSTRKRKSSQPARSGRSGCNTTR